VPAPAPGLEELLAQIAAGIHYALHPVSTLLGRLGVSVTGDIDIPMWALLVWFLGSRESENAKKLGFLVAVGLAALAAVELSLAPP